MEAENLSRELGKAICVAMGLMIFAKHGDHEVGVEHDKIWAGEQVEAEETILLDNLGWLWDEEYNSWFIFT